MFLVNCGPNLEIPDQIANIITMIITLIKIGVPILLIIFGMLDLGKSVMAQKEDEIKKGQQLFMKRLISAAIVFFVVTVVGFVMQILDTPVNNKSQYTASGTQWKNNETGAMIDSSAYQALPDTGDTGWSCASKIINGK